MKYKIKKLLVLGILLLIQLPMQAKIVRRIAHSLHSLRKVHTPKLHSPTPGQYKIRDVFGKEQWVTAQTPLVMASDGHLVFKPADFDNYQQSFFGRLRHSIGLRWQAFAGRDFPESSMREQCIYYAAAENNPQALRWYLKNVNPTIREIERPLMDMDLQEQSGDMLKTAAREKRNSVMVMGEYCPFY